MSYTTTMRQGENKVLYGTVVPNGTFAEIIGTPTYTVYDSNSIPVTGMTAQPVTGNDKGDWSLPSAWILLNTAGLQPGYYTLVFKINSEDSQNFNVVQEPTVILRVLASYDTFGQTNYYGKPLSTFAGITNLFGNKFIVATKGNCGTNAGFSVVTGSFNSTDANHNGSYVTSHTFVEQSSGITVTFLGQSIEGLTGNTETIACSMRYLGVNYQFTFGGAHTGTLLSGGRLTSDVLTGVTVVKGDTPQFVTWTSVPVGGRWPLGTAASNVVSGEGYTTNVDLTTGLVAAASTTIYTRSPNAINGTPTGPAYISQVLMVGDSIITGKGDDSAGGPFDRGFAVLALNSNYGYFKLSLSSETADTFNNLSPLRHVLAAGGAFNYAIVEYGNNDLFNAPQQTAAAVTARLQTLVTYLVGLGMIVDVCTVTPRCTSGNSFLNLAGQTLFSVGQEAQRVILNTTIRALGIVGMRNCLDISTPIESGFNSGFWLTNGTANYYVLDGTHPSPNGTVLMAAAINAATYAP